MIINDYNKRGSNKGKSYVRVEISPKQKELIESLAELRGVKASELLTQVIERFIDNNLQVCDVYRISIEEVRKEMSKKISMKV